MVVSNQEKYIIFTIVRSFSGRISYISIWGPVWHLGQEGNPEVLTKYVTMRFQGVSPQFGTQLWPSNLHLKTDSK